MSETTSSGIGATSAPNQKNIFIVSNRLPITIKKDPESGSYRFNPSAGGLVTGLKEIHQSGGGLWIGHCGIFDNDPSFESLKADLLNKKYLAVGLRRKQYTSYYNGMSNATIWPLFHYFSESVRFSDQDWESYKEVNKQFAEAILEHAGENDMVWVHDYQLMLLPQLLRKEAPNLQIAYFHHIPFPSSEIFRIIPARTEILDGLLGADLVGFHTFDYARHFISSVSRTLNCATHVDEIHHNHRRIKVSAFPLGIDVPTYTSIAQEHEHSPATHTMLEEFRNKAVLLGVDRLDYTKGIPERLQAFQAFLRRHREYIGKVVFVQVCVPSRADIKAYGNLRSQVERLIGEISGEFGAPGYAPIHYIYRNLPVHEVVSLYRRADVMLVTPLRDGLNLVCKEYVAVQQDDSGSLILSEFTGAASEMGEAYIVNPYNINEVADTIHQAITDDITERSERMGRLRERVLKFDNIAWSKEFIRQWQAFTKHASKSIELVSTTKEQLIEQARNAKRLFICCDYDGTLVPIVAHPESAIPNDEVHSLIAQMASNPSIEFTLVTGRQRQFCEQHFTKDLVHIACEHGLYARFVDEKSTWFQQHGAEEFERLKPEIMGLLNLYTRSLPGSRIEEKESSLVWHFRNVKGVFADGQALRLRDELKQLLAGTTYAAFAGKKVVDIRPVLANKGHAVEFILDHLKFDFDSDMLVCLGDDITDEDMFQAHQKVNHSINVGGINLFSRYFLKSQKDVIPLLIELLDVKSSG